MRCGRREGKERTERAAGLLASAGGASAGGASADGSPAARVDLAVRNPRAAAAVAQGEIALVADEIASRLGSGRRRDGPAHARVHAVGRAAGRASRRSERSRIGIEHFVAFEVRGNYTRAAGARAGAVLLRLSCSNPTVTP